MRDAANPHRFPPARRRGLAGMGSYALSRASLRKARLAARLLLGAICLLVFLVFVPRIPQVQNTTSVHVAFDVAQLQEHGGPKLPTVELVRPPPPPAETVELRPPPPPTETEGKAQESEAKAEGGDISKAPPRKGGKKKKKKPKETAAAMVDFKDPAGQAGQTSAEVKAEVQRMVEAQVRALGGGGGVPQERFECDRGSPLTDVCTVKGDVRMDLRSQRIVLYAKNPDTPRGELVVRPHPRKWDYNVMNEVSQQKLQSIAEEDDPAPLQCTRRHTAPAVVFSVGGYCGGVFHDFNEVFLPLFQTVHSYQRDVVFIVADLKGPWWWHGPAKESFVGAMTQHPIRLLGSETDADGNPQEGVDCYDSVTVGLWHNLCMYDEFGGREMRSETIAGVLLRDFAPFVAQGLGVTDVKYTPVRVPKGTQPVVGLVQRLATRCLVNYEELVEAGEKAGFRVIPVVFEHMSAADAVRLMAEIDVLVGVHGAGLSNICLMRPGGVVLQMMPYGEWGWGRVVGLEYRNMAEVIGGRHIEWHVPLQDSSLVHAYDLTDPVLLDPDRIWREHYTIGAMRIYHAQNITMPQDMFGAYMRHIRRDLQFRERVFSISQGSADVPQDNKVQL